MPWQAIMVERGAQTDPAALRTTETQTEPLEVDKTSISSLDYILVTISRSFSVASGGSGTCIVTIARTQRPHSAALAIIYHRLSLLLCYLILTSVAE